MSKIVRYTGNLRAFGSNAQGLERTLFGETAQADDLTSQITAAFLRGWGIVGPSENPSLEDFNAAMYTMSQFIAYQHQMGVPEWDAAQEYYVGSLCVRAGETYSSLANGNIGSAPPSAKWTQVITVKNGLTSLGLADAEGYVGRLLNVHVLVSSGTYTPTPGTKKAIVEMVGGGGASGGTPASTSGANFASGGAGSGAYIKFVLDNPVETQVTIGKGGVVSGGAGLSGGATSFGDIATVGGGGGSAYAQAGGGALLAIGGNGGGAISAPGRRIVAAVQGERGGSAVMINGGAGTGNNGASSPFGRGGTGSGNGNGGTPTGYGSGAGGAMRGTNNTGQPSVGAAGADGLIVVWEYS